MTGTIFLVGTAGSGKTEMTLALSEWFKREEQRVAIVNLDPGVLKIPYTADIDVREYVDVTELMVRYGLGPNGGLVLAMDLAVNHLQDMNRRIRDMNPDYLLVDTSGQMELFAYRSSGALFARDLYGDTKAMLVLIDGLLCRDPRNFVSNLLLSSSIHFRFMLSTFNILNKVDLLDEKDRRTLTRWSKSVRHLIKSLEESVKGEEILYLSRVSRLLYQYFEKAWFIPVSAYTLYNLPNVVSALTRILFRGEERLY